MEYLIIDCWGKPGEPGYLHRQQADSPDEAVRKWFGLELSVLLETFTSVEADGKREYYTILSSTHDIAVIVIPGSPSC